MLYMNLKHYPTRLNEEMNSLPIYIVCIYIVAFFKGISRLRKKKIAVGKLFCLIIPEAEVV